MKIMKKLFILPLLILVLSACVEYDAPESYVIPVVSDEVKKKVVVPVVEELLNDVVETTKPAESKTKVVEPNESIPDSNSDVAKMKVVAPVSEVLKNDLVQTEVEENQNIEEFLNEYFQKLI